LLNIFLKVEGILADSIPRTSYTRSRAERVPRASEERMSANKLAKRASLGVIAGALALLGAISANAFWTTGGAGSGTATAGTTADNLGIASPLVTGVTPGSSTPVTVTLTNPNSYSVYVDTVSTVITTSDVGCPAADFTFPAKAMNATVAALGTASFTQDLVFADTAANQDPCKGAAITLTYSST
jgi:hypothetical protein